MAGEGLEVGRLCWVDGLIWEEGGGSGGGGYVRYVGGMKWCLVGERDGEIDENGGEDRGGKWWGL